VRKVLLYSLLLVAGLIVSQFIAGAPVVVTETITFLTMFALSFIMIHVGYEFEIDKSRPRQYLWDYVVAGTAAAFPWILCAMYFVYVMAPPELWSNGDLWREALLEARFASPTSAGVLFSMLAAAGLAATWMFKKARILAIFDDLDTILLMIPLKIMMVGFRWQLVIVVVLIAVMLWLAWRYLHVVRLPVTWPYVLAYALAITAVSEVIYLTSALIDADVPIHLEVLLPAFVLGSMLARPRGADPHANDGSEGAHHGPESPEEQRVSTIVSVCFMVLVGLSMPAIGGGGNSGGGETVPLAADVPTQIAPTAAAGLPNEAPVAPPPPPQKKKALAYDGVPAEVLEAKDKFPGWDTIALHVLAITFLSNLGKMFPAFCYRREATLRERIALSVAMFPRGEVGAGVLVVSLSYGLGGPALTVAVLSLALNLVCTGIFIIIVKKLLTGSEPRPVVA
jgi:Kef-type K+ transport system membrane component KefB